MEDFDNIVQPFYQCNVQTKLYVLFPFSIGQNFSGGMYVWAGSSEDFDNIVRPLSSIPTDTRFFRIRQAQMGTQTEHRTSGKSNFLTVELPLQWFGYKE
jgi:hypothetical protein